MSTTEPIKILDLLQIKTIPTGTEILTTTKEWLILGPALIKQCADIRLRITDRQPRHDYATDGFHWYLYLGRISQSSYDIPDCIARFIEGSRGSWASAKTEQEAFDLLGKAFIAWAKAEAAIE